jgi:hypothetical protein
MHFFSILQAVSLKKTVQNPKPGSAQKFCKSVKVCKPIFCKLMTTNQIHRLFYLHNVLLIIQIRNFVNPFVNHQFSNILKIKSV